MFNAPKIIENIPDIKQIYAINDTQSADLDTAIEMLDDNIFLSRMHEDIIERWEKMLGISVLDDDTIEERRFRIKTRATEKLPYSWTVLHDKLETLCADGYSMAISEDRTTLTVKIALKTKRMIDDVIELLDELLPLNIFFRVVVLYNQYEIVQKYTYEQLAERTHAQIREEEM